MTLYNIVGTAASMAVKSSVKSALMYESAKTKDSGPPPARYVPRSTEKPKSTTTTSSKRYSSGSTDVALKGKKVSIGESLKIKGVEKPSVYKAPATQSFQQRGAGPQTSTNNLAAATNLGFAGASIATSTGAMSAAALGPLAVAAFGIMAMSRIQQAREARQAAKRAQKNERDLFISKSMLFENRMALENYAMVDTLNQVERQGQKNRSMLDIAKGESVAGQTLNMLRQDQRRNELEYKERLIDQNVQKRIAQREHLVAAYHATRVKMEDIASMAPSNSDVMLGIVSDGVGIAASYYGATT